MRQTNNCIDCGKPIKKESTRCHSCANRNNNLGSKASDEAKRNISKASKGKKKPQSMIDKITGKGNHFFGKKHSKESLQKMKDAKTGISLSESHKRSIGAKHKGIPLSEQHKRNISNAQKGDKCYRWTGGIINVHGYILIKQDDGQYKQEHRIIMERHIKRNLTHHEIVHHINQIRDDNRIENLQIMDNKSHMELHNKLMRLNEIHPNQSKLL